MSGDKEKVPESSGSSGEGGGDSLRRQEKVIEEEERRSRGSLQSPPLDLWESWDESMNSFMRFVVVKVAMEIPPRDLASTPPDDDHNGEGGAMLTIEEESSSDGTSAGRASPSDSGRGQSQEDGGEEAQSPHSHTDSEASQEHEQPEVQKLVEDETSEELSGPHPSLSSGSLTLKEQVETLTSQLPDGDVVETGRWTNILELLASTGASADGNNMMGTMERDQLLSCVRMAVSEQLKNLGVKLKPPGSPSKWWSRERKQRSNKGNRRDTGANRLVEAKLQNWAVTVKVPILIKESCDFLREHITTEGIFRIPGSTLRIRSLMQRIESLERNEAFNFIPTETAFDVAQALVQFLGQVQVIPPGVQHLFRQALELPSESFREEAVILCTYLLSESSIGVLAYLIEFIMEVADRSKLNRMDAKNMAIIMGSNIMPLNYGRNDLAADIKKVIESHTKIVEILIRNGKKLGSLPPELQKQAETDFSSLQASEGEGKKGTKPGRSYLRRLFGKGTNPKDKDPPPPVAVVKTGKWWNRTKRVLTAMNPFSCGSGGSRTKN